MSVKPIPDGVPTIVPYLCAKGAAEAIEFYKKAFGAEEVLARITDGQGRVGHAELKVGDSIFYLSDEHPEYGVTSPATQGGSPVHFVIHVENVDTVFPRALEAGGQEVRPLADQFYGDRSGTLKDPYGYQWTLSTHIEDVSEEELQRRAKELEG